MTNLSDDQLQELRQKLSARGRDVNEKIIALQSGKTLPANATDVPFAEPGEQPEQRLKRFLSILQSKMRTIREGGDYGSCTSCNDGIAYDVLSREPWRETCYSCA